MLTDAIRRLHRIPQIFLDGGIALVLMLSAGLAAYQDSGGLSPLQALMVALITLPVAARCRFPTVVSAIIGAALILNVMLGFTNSFIENFAILLALYTMYASAPADIRLAIMSGVVVVVSSPASRSDGATSIACTCTILGTTQSYSRCRPSSGTGCARAEPTSRSCTSDPSYWRGKRWPRNAPRSRANSMM